MSFKINKNIVFIDSMLFINSSLDSLVKNLIDGDIKYLSEEYSGEFLKLVKEKGVYPYEHMNSFKKINENKLLDKWEFFSSLKDSSISNEEYDIVHKIWNLFKINNMGYYQDR